MKTRLTLLLLLVPLWSAMAYDYGFNLSDATALGGGTELSINQSNKAELWLEMRLGEARFRGEVVYDFAASWSPSRTSLSPYRLDAGRLDLAGITRLGELGTLDWDLGRMAMADLSGLVVGGKADGLAASLYRGNLRFTTQAYYTGLVVKKNSRVSVTDQDRADASDDKIALAPRRAVYALNLGVKELFLRQDFDVEALGSTDLRSDSKQAMSTYFATARLSGPFLPLTRYKLGGVGELMTPRAGLTWAGAAFAEIATSLPWQSTKIALEATTTAPLMGPGPSVFTPLGAKPLSAVAPSLSVGNVTALVTDLSFRPVSRLTWGARPGAFFRTTERTNPLPQADAKASGLYLGSEVQTYFSWRLASELTLAGNAGVFLPNPNLQQSGGSVLYSVAVSATASL